MNVTRIPSGSAAVLALDGKVVTGEDLAVLEAEVDALVAAGFVHLVFDLAEVPWLNSTGLGALITAHGKLGRAGGTMALCALNERLRAILKVSRLERVFKVFPDRESALAGRA